MVKAPEVNNRSEIYDGPNVKGKQAEVPVQQDSGSACKASGTNKRKKPPATAENLPPCVYSELFSYLENKDLMSIRSVCTTWNKQISTWGRMRDAATFKVKRTEFSSDPGNSYAILNKSEVPWKKMELENIKTAVYPMWNFPKDLNSSLKTLTLKECTFTWSSMVNIASRFLSLTKLILLNCNMELNSPVRWYRNRDSFDSEALLCDVNGPKRRILLRLEMDDHQRIQFCLRQFQANNEESPFLLGGVELVLPALPLEDESEPEAGIVPETNGTPEGRRFFVSFRGARLGKVVEEFDRLEATGCEITQREFQKIFTSGKLGFVVQSKII